LIPTSTISKNNPKYQNQDRQLGRFKKIKIKAMIKKVCLIRRKKMLRTASVAQEEEKREDVEMAVPLAGYKEATILRRPA
jgi:hypothetical protein